MSVDGVPSLLFPDGRTLSASDAGGRTLQVGDRLKLRITDATERCRMVTLGQSELPEDVRILREIAGGLDTCFGVYAEVVAPGELRVGDSVTMV